jgi:hypothetical protein
MSETRRVRWRGAALAAIGALVVQLIFMFVGQPFGPAATAALWIFGIVAFFGGALAVLDSVRSWRTALRSKDS